MSSENVVDFLKRPKLDASVALLVLVGSDAFLRLATRQALFPPDGDTAPTIFAGETASFADVMDEVATQSLFDVAGSRVAWVQNADKFVTAHRAALETFAGKPKGAGLLALEVTAFPSNTRLAKIADEKGRIIQCKLPEKKVGKNTVLDEKKAVAWIREWGESKHGVKLSEPAAKRLIDLSEDEAGLIDSHLAKLALYAEPKQELGPEEVQSLVGGWKLESAFEMMDAAADGDAAGALLKLNHLVRAGEAPQALFGSISWHLRRLATATRRFEDAEIAGRRITLRQALLEAGVPHWDEKGLTKGEKHLKRIGRTRAGACFAWLRETDLALKGSHSREERALRKLEELLMRLAANSPSAATSASGGRPA